MKHERFAERLREERKKRGLTQKELGDRCGFETSIISRYESGSREPGSKALTKLSETLGISVDYLMGLSNNPNSQIASTDLDPRESELVATFRQDGWPGILRLGAEKMTK